MKNTKITNDSWNGHYSRDEHDDGIKKGALHSASSRQSYFNIFRTGDRIGDDE